MSQFVSHFHTSDTSRRAEPPDNTNRVKSHRNRAFDQESFQSFIDSLSTDQLSVFLDTLAPNQVSMLILSGVLDDKFLDVIESESDFDASYPSKTEPEGFDFEKWKNRPGLKIR